MLPGYHDEKISELSLLELIVLTASPLVSLDLPRCRQALNVRDRLDQPYMSMHILL